MFIEHTSELIVYIKSPIFYNSERVQANDEVFVLKQLSLKKSLQTVIFFIIVLI